MKIKILTILAVLFLFLSPLAFIKAAEPQTGNLHIQVEEIVNRNLYVLGEEITVDGTVGGDLIVISQKLTVNGRVEGDIIALSQEIKINGEVSGDIRVAGGSVLINGKVGRNLNVFSPDITIGSEARIAWDVYLIGSTAKVEGTIDGSLNGRLDNVLINAQIGKDLDLKMNEKSTTNTSPTAPRIRLTEETIINGNFTYRSLGQADFSQAIIAGETSWLTPQKTKDNNSLLWLWKELFLIFSALVVGLVLIFSGRKITKGVLTEMESTPLKTGLPGVLILLITPLLVFILALTIIGLPLAMIIAAVWLIALYVSKVLTAILLGQMILKKTKVSGNGTEIYALVSGVVITWLLFALPYVGWIIYLLATCFGLGGIWNYVKHQSQNI